MHKIRPIIILLVIVGGGYWYFTRYPGELTRLRLQLGFISETDVSDELVASGFIEAEEIEVAAETRGRITQITVAEGDFVEAGQILVTLDTALLDTQIVQAQAKIATAQAQLAKVKAGVRAEEIAKAEAAVALAEANAEAAHTLWQNAVLLRDNPQELDMQIDAAKTALELATLRITSTIPLKDAGETLWELRSQQWDYIFDEHRVCQFGRCITLRFPEGTRQDASIAWNYAGADMWAAWVDLNTAIAARDDAETALNDLLRLRDDPQEAQLQVTQTQAAYQTALTQIEVAQAQLERLKAGARPEQIALAQAQVEQAEANLAALRVQRDKYMLVAPRAGWVVERVAHEGEMASPGASLLTLADLNDVTLTVYVAVPNIDAIAVGQKVEVLVDAFPNESFTGRLNFISSEAEFTPKNIQTKEERINTVYGVKIKLENEQQRLKPGMPADAVLFKGRGL
jgi:HlyD family secretion protein